MGLTQGIRDKIEALLERKTSKGSLGDTGLLESKLKHIRARLTASCDLLNASQSIRKRKFIASQNSVFFDATITMDPGLAGKLASELNTAIEPILERYQEVLYQAACDEIDGEGELLITR